MNLDIFHAYDVRGIYPQDIDEDACYAIAGRYVELFSPKGPMAVGMDARTSSPSLKENVVKGFLDFGVDVVDIGEITTDMLYFAVGHYGYAGGMVVSASHNPGQYNGLKMVKEGVAAVSADTGLYALRDALRERPEVKPPAVSKGTYTRKDVTEDYLAHVLSFADLSRIRPCRIVANGNFGFVSRNVNRLAERMGLDLVRLNFEPDGTFPKGPPNPMLEGNRGEVVEAVRRSGAAFAAMWDADADRVMFLDEQGRFVHGIYITALLAEVMLEKHPGAKIIFDPRVVWPAFDTVRRCGGVPIMAKSGHAFMKDRMRAEDAVFAGELSAHYYFRDNFYADNGLIPFLLVLERFSVLERPFSEMTAPYMQNHCLSGEINYTVGNVAAVIDKVKARFSGRGREDYTDGYSVEGDDWRFNLRSSNTEPLLRLNLEALDRRLMEERRDEVLSFIRS